MDGYTAFWLVSAAASLYVGWRIGKEKGRHGFWWAFFLGWIGVFIVWRLKPLTTMTEAEYAALQNEPVRMTEAEWAKRQQPPTTAAEAWAEAQPLKLKV